MNTASQSKEKRITQEMIIAIICFLFSVVALLLTRNEIYQDDSYIEGSADGLFGSRSILVVGTNFLFTGIIYLLSLTGIRLFWLHILMLIMHVISHFIVCRIIAQNIKSNIKYVVCILYLLIITPFISFYMQFTTTAAYTIAAGCVYLFDAIDSKKSRKHYWFGIGWIVLGAALRVDCIYYSLVFMGLAWLMKYGRSIISKRKWKSLILKVWPFVVAICIVVILECTQGILMSVCHPGFKDWNDIRCKVDDYQIPDYLSNIEKYQEIGISYNDYKILKSWNNQDPEFFTQDLYEKIKEIKDTNMSEEKQGNGVLECITNNANVMTSMNTFLFVGVGVIVLLFFGKKKLVLELAILILAAFGLSTYFSYTGRLIWRTEWPIWIVLILACLVILLKQKILNVRFKVAHWKKYTFYVLVVICVLFMKTPSKGNYSWDPYKGNSLYQIYVERATNKDNFAYYLKNELMKDENIVTDTMDEAAAKYMEENQDTLFFPLWTSGWLQQYPVNDRNILVAAPLGSAANRGTLGQYTVKLTPTMNMMEKYGITNPFRDLVAENVRVAIKASELMERSKELNIYLQEHYYEDVNFSVDKIVSNTVFGRYICNFDTTQMQSINGKIEVGIYKGSSYWWMAEVKLLNYTLEKEIEKIDEMYIQVHDECGNIDTFVLADLNSDVPSTFIYEDILREGGKYTVDFIVSSNDKWFVCENAGNFELRSVNDENSVENLDLSIIDTSQTGAVKGYYANQSGYAWTQKYSSVILQNSLVGEEGLELDLQLFDFTELGTEPIRIYVNGECVYEVSPKGGLCKIIITPDIISSSADRYIVEIECPYIINPAKRLGTNDDRDLAVKVYYIGVPSSCPTWVTELFGG